MVCSTTARGVAIFSVAQNCFFVNKKIRNGAKRVAYLTVRSWHANIWEEIAITRAIWHFDKMIPKMRVDF